jgi:hypothetical protein
MRTRFIALAAALALLVSAFATSAVASASTYGHRPSWGHHHRKCVKHFNPYRRVIVKKCFFKRHGKRVVLVIVVKLPPKQLRPTQPPTTQPQPQPGS